VITVVPTENALGAFVSYTGDVIANATPPAAIDAHSEVTGPQPAGVLDRHLRAEVNGLSFGLAIVRGHASPGALGGFVSVEAGITAGIVGSNAGAQGLQSLEWGDRLLIVGEPSLPPGTHVQVRAILSLSSQVSMVGESCHAGFAGPTAEARLLVRGFFTLPVADVFCDGPPAARIVSQVFDTRVGAAVDVSGSLSTRAIVTAVSPVFDARGVVDAESTAVTYLDCLTPGCSYTTESGFDYTAPRETVPEPGMLMLLAIGVAGVWTLGRTSRPT